MKEFVVNHFPFLGKYKRFLKALIQSRQQKRLSFSQHGEDKFVFENLLKFDLFSGIYVDVGANHPTDISNTYLFYKNGFRGVIVEPNKEFSSLYGFFRKRDFVFSVGCGAVASLLPFNISKTPVLSSFGQIEDTQNAWKTEFVPVFPLDTIVNAIKHEWIFFLNIDVEGFTEQVVAGGENTINNSLFLCIELDLIKEKHIAEQIEKCGMEVFKVVECNVVFKNRNQEKFKNFLKVL